MKINNENPISISRRRLLKGVGLGLAVSSFGASRSFALQNTNANIDPMEMVKATDVVMQYLRARSNQNVSLNSPYSSFIDPGASNLRSWENHRHDIFANLGDSSKWNGKIESCVTQPQIQSISQIGDLLVVIVYEWIDINWRPLPNNYTITPAEELLKNQYPSKYGVDQPWYQLVDSGFGITHTIKLNKVGTNWLIVQDGYSEFAVAGDSPDFVSNLPKSLKNIPLIASDKHFAQQENLLGLTFDYVSSVNYALAWANSYNTPTYRNFSPDDCANFVSQCFTAGGYPVDSSWYKYSSAWDNNASLRSWLISSGRGVAASSAGALGYSDIVNFAFTGVYDHVVIVTGLPGPLISCHSNPSRNVPYSTYASSGISREFATTYLYY